MKDRRLARESESEDARSFHGLQAVVALKLAVQLNLKLSSALRDQQCGNTSGYLV